jgi:O-acetyl-ADP-ribose deacetylase (regulator of RNase III)
LIYEVLLHPDAQKVYINSNSSRRVEASMITFISGDLLQTSADYIAQGVATGSQEGLGTGLARKISTKWPEVQQQFKKYTRNTPFRGGDLFVVPPASGRPGVIYIATQPDMYHATIPFLNRGLRNVIKYCQTKRIESVALPKIGAGLGKLDWETDVKPLLMQYLTESETIFSVYEDFKHVYER